MRFRAVAAIFVGTVLMVVCRGNTLEGDQVLALRPQCAVRGLLLGSRSGPDRAGCGGSRGCPCPYLGCSPRPPRPRYGLPRFLPAAPSSPSRGARSCRPISTSQQRSTPPGPPRVLQRPWGNGPNPVPSRSLIATTSTWYTPRSLALIRRGRLWSSSSRS